MLRKTVLALTLICAATAAQGRTHHPNFSIKFAEDNGGLSFTYDKNSGLYSVEGTGDDQGTPGIASATPVKVPRFGKALAVTLGISTANRATTMFISYPIVSGGRLVTYQHPEGGGMLKVAIDNYNVVDRQ
jgi:hypothetical protein